MTKPTRLYRCPTCAGVLTEREFEEQMESGGSGYCDCGFMAYDDEGEVYFPRLYYEYDVYSLVPRSSNQTVKKEVS